MNSNYTIQFNKRLIEEYLGINLFAFLIRLPSLGLTDTPTSIQLNARRALTMQAAAAAEILGTHGYSRVQVILQEDLTNTDLTKKVYSGSASFSADNQGSFELATHICYARGAAFTRADSSGTLVKVEPLLNAPFSITAGVTFSHQTQFITRFSST